MASELRTGIYRGVTLDEANAAYHAAAADAAAEGFAPVSEQWSTALGQSVLTVTYAHLPDQAAAVLEAIRQTQVDPSLCPACGKRLSPVWRTKCEHCKTPFNPDLLAARARSVGTPLAAIPHSQASVTRATGLAQDLAVGQATRRGWSTRRKIVVAAAVVFVGLLIVGALAGPPSPNPRPIATPTQPGSSATKTVAAQRVTLLDTLGSGINKTKPFTTTGPWTIAYTYDCTAFGQNGLLQIFVYSPPESLEDIAVNELGKNGSGSTQQYGTGDFYLQMNSVCDWTVKVTQP
jgi:hypothetical protein